MWSKDPHGTWRRPLPPVDILILGDTRRRVGLPMAARYARQKGDSIFESSLSNAFLYMLLAAHNLGLAAQPASAVKYPKVQGLVKHLLNLPDFIYVYDLLQVGYRAEGSRPSQKSTRSLADLAHRDRAGEDEFMTERELHDEIRALRSGNVSRHAEITTRQD
jgi:nitroreductase